MTQHTRILTGLAALSLIACSGDSEPPFPTGATPTPTPTSSFEGVTTAEIEPNGTAEQAQTVSIGYRITGTMAPGDTDLFRLFVPPEFEGYKLSFSVVDGVGDCFTGVDPNLAIMNSSGALTLAFVEDSFEHYCPTLSFVPDPGNTYLVRVSTDWTLSGAYLLSVDEGGPGSISGALSPAKVAVEAPARRALVEGDGLLQLTPGATAAQVQEGLRRRLGGGARLVRPVMGGRYWLLSAPVPAGLTPESRRAFTLDLLRRAQAVPGVASAQPNGLLQPEAQPNDPGLADQWHYEPAPGMNVEAAWDVTTGSSAVVVAVIDTGHDDNHPDLRDKVAPGGYDFITDPSNAGDGDGPDGDPADAIKNGHGTHVAGTIAANTNNSTGVAGVGWATRYMPLRVCGNYGCTEADIAEAIYYAAGYETVAGSGRSTPRADVINMSLGGHDSCSGPLQDAVWAASQRGVIVVVAAGNSADDAADYSPAGCDDVISVAALDTSAKLANFSNYGDAVDIAAPGVNILSTYEDGQYAYLAGTSMASPHIAGLAALLKSVDVTFTFDIVRDLLQQTANRSFSCAGVRSCGAGLADAFAAVNLALETPGGELPTPWVVQAVNLADPTLVYSTFAPDLSFELLDLPAGTYRLQVGVQSGGDLTLADPLSVQGQFTITDIGDDLTGVVVPLPLP